MQKLDSFKSEQLTRPFEVLVFTSKEGVILTNVYVCLIYKVLASRSGMLERPPISIWSQVYTGGPTV